MRVALTGASGFIGSHIARLVHESGGEVVALVRETSRREHIDRYISRYASGDLTDPTVWPALLNGCDACVHDALDWASLRQNDLDAHLRTNLDASIRLLHAAHAHGVRRFVFLSSVATIHDVSPTWNGMINEEHPLRPRGLYGAAKAAVEPFLWDAYFRLGMHTAALRPAAVYGLEPPHKIEKTHGWDIAQTLLAGNRVTPQDFPGGGKWVHVEDVALAAVRALERDEAAGCAFNLADTYAKRTRFAEHAADILGLDPSMVEPDHSPPARNQFDKTASRETLGVPLDRGDDGLREHMEQVIDAVRARQ